ncbi:Protein GrpE [Methanimicrococcus sp. At1]|uniref:Protein GrpE n=1 Tax=Methanimicrococcus hacksteinii TaxID=3028293 RepID=A0ABU3VQK0_9EURY|nr:nucleotide exchange factor GrpE [Methanimicrococcus sp. At1]MDV0445694.1 Protein GrpE [Methanimicrococcus sp. At1]
MNHTKYENEVCAETDSAESCDDSAFMSECIPEEDGGTTLEDGAANAGPCASEKSGALADENAVLLKRVEDLTSAYLTLAADFENYKKRTQKHMEDVKKFASEPLMIDMIEVADNFERAIVSAEKETADKESLMEGVKNTYRQFMTLLESHGLSKISSDPGTEFDPHLHESVAQIPTAEFPDETIMEVFKPGYTLNAKVIRPAAVTVSTEPDE